MHTKAHVLIYDTDNILYYQGMLTDIECKPSMITYESLDGTRENFIRDYNVNMVCSSLDKSDNIMLDAATMKRIAKYNKEAECIRLDKEILKKKEQIKELDKKLSDKEKRWKMVKEYVANIYEIDLDCYDDYD